MTIAHTKTSAWWTTDVHADRRPFLMTRNAIQASLRGFFATRDFLEVDTSILQVSPGNEAHLHAFATEAISLDGQRRPFYLHTSPEFAMKKLLAAGESRIFTFAHTFRNRECGPMHHPEFTMLEWYRAGESYERLMEDCAVILSRASERAKTDKFHWRGVTCDPFLTPERLSVAEAFGRYAGIELFSTLSPEGLTDRESFAAVAAEAGIRVAEDDTWSDIFSRVLVEKIEPYLGHGRPTILDQYPVSEAALARRSPQDHRVAERFELYVCGVELANGFGELTDAEEQRRRFEEEMKVKHRIYGESYPLDEDFLDAVSVMPEAAGIALGFERLVMLAAGATRIEQVMWAPVAIPAVEAEQIEVKPEPRPAAHEAASAVPETQPPVATADFAAMITAAVAGVSMGQNVVQAEETVESVAADNEFDYPVSDEVVAADVYEDDTQVSAELQDPADEAAFAAFEEMSDLSGASFDIDEPESVQPLLSDLDPEDLPEPVEAEIESETADDAEPAVDIAAADDADGEPAGDILPADAVPAAAGDDRATDGAVEESSLDVSVDEAAMEAEILAALVLEPELSIDEALAAEKVEDAGKTKDASAHDDDEDPFAGWDGLDLLDLKEAKG